MMGYSLEKIAILTAKGAIFTCILWGISRNEGLRRLKNFVFEDKSVLKMGFRANKTHIQVIREGVFGSTYFRDIYSVINEKWYKKSMKESDQLKYIDQKYYSSDYYDISVNKYGVECRKSLRFWENKGWINERDPYG